MRLIGDNNYTFFRRRAGFQTHARSENREASDARLFFIILHLIIIRSLHLLKRLHVKMRLP